MRLKAVSTITTSIIIAAAVGETTNTELVIEHAEKLEIPMDFTAGLVEMARGDNHDYEYEANMIEAVFEACDSETQSINVAEMLLADRFPVFGSLPIKKRRPSAGGVRARSGVSQVPATS